MQQWIHFFMRKNVLVLEYFIFYTMSRDVVLVTSLIVLVFKVFGITIKPIITETLLIGEV